MKFIILSFYLCLFGSFALAETPFNNKAWGIVHIEHPDHVPHHPGGKDPTEKWSHDGIVYPRKRVKKWLFEVA